MIALFIRSMPKRNINFRANKRLCELFSVAEVGVNRPHLLETPVATQQLHSPVEEISSAGFCEREFESHPLESDGISSFDQIMENIFLETSEPDPTNKDSQGRDQEASLLSLADELLMFLTIYNISNSAMSYLLRILMKHGVDVPRSLYPLKKNNETLDWSSFNLSSGQVAYLSIEENLSFLLQWGLLKLQSSLQIDGLYFTSKLSS